MDVLKPAKQKQDARDLGKGAVAAEEPALSLPSPCAFFAFLFTERLFTTISEPGTGYYWGRTGQLLAISPLSSITIPEVFTKS